MKKFSVSTLITLLALVAIVGVALAEASALPGGGWYTGETIQNVSAGTAQVKIVAYEKTGSTVYETASVDVPSGGSKTFLPADFATMPTGFEGSAIVSASADIRAIVNVTNRASGVLGDPASPSPAAAQYQGMNVGATTINFPLVKNVYFNKTTAFFIQNAGSAAATATATFYLDAGTYTFTTTSIGPGQMAVVLPSDARNASSQPPPAGAIGSLTVTSAQNLAGTMLEYRPTEVNATILQASRAFTAADYSMKAYSPTNKNDFYGRFTGLQVQNVTGAAIDVTVTYTGIGFSGATNCTGTTYVDTKTALAAGASHTFASATKLPAGCLASATIEGTGNIVAVINESYTTAWLNANPGRFQESTTYAAIPDSLKTTKISLPTYKEYSYAKGTGVSIQNVGGGVASVVITFVSPAGTFVSQPQSVAVGAALVISDARNRPAAFWNGTAMTPTALACGTGVTGCGGNGLMGMIVTSNQPIVAIANESTYPFANPLIKQDKNNYEGFNLVP